jgi:hypothetical protein
LDTARRLLPLVLPIALIVGAIWLIFGHPLVVSAPAGMALVIVMALKR